MFDKGNKLIGCLNFNNMLPVDDSVLLPIDMRVQKGDSAKERMTIMVQNQKLFENLFKEFENGSLNEAKNIAKEIWKGEQAAWQI